MIFLASRRLRERLASLLEIVGEFLKRMEGAYGYAMDGSDCWLLSGRLRRR